MNIKLEGWLFMTGYMAEAMNARLREIFAEMDENIHYIRRGKKSTLLKAGAGLGNLMLKL